MNRSRLAALSAGAMFLVASVFVPATTMADTGSTNTIKVLGAPSFNPAVSSGSFTVHVVGNGAVAISGAGAGLAFDNTKLTLTALTATNPTGSSVAGFDNSATGIANDNTAGQVPNISWFYISGSQPANTDIGVFDATFSIKATGDSTLTPNQTPQLLDGTAATYGAALATTAIAGTVVNHTAPIWSLSAPASASVLTGASSAGSTVTTPVTQGDPGTISFAASGLPSGVTASFSPATVAPGAGPSSGTTTLTFTATGAAAPGTSTVTITATDTESPAVSHAATISLQVVGNNDFGISASPSSISVTAGTAGPGPASSPVTVSTTVLTGTPGAINLSASGLPTGVVATFTPASVTGAGSSQLTLTADSTAVGGVSTVTIHGNNGTYDHTATVALNVIVTPAGGQNVNVNGTLDSGFLGLTCPNSLTIPLVRGNTNQLNVPCQIYTNTVWNLNVNDTATDAYTGHMVTGRPVDGTTTFAIADSMHVLANQYIDVAGNAAYHNNVDLSAGGTILTGTNSAPAPLVLSQYVRASTHPGSYGIQVLFSAMSIF